MSNNNDQDAAGEVLAEIKREVVITAEDCNAAFDFWKHFKIPPIPGLKESIDAFAAEPTFENQQQIKYYICKAIAETDHEAFKDPLFEKIVAECADVGFDMQFDKDLEKALTTTEE